MGKMTVEDVRRDPSPALNDDSGSALTMTSYDFVRDFLRGDEEDSEVMHYELTCTECESVSEVTIRGRLGLSPHCACCNSTNFSIRYDAERSNVPEEEIANGA